MRKTLSTKASTGGRASKTSSKKLDINKYVNKWYSELYSFLGLDILGLDSDQGFKVLVDVLDKLYGEASSSPTLDAVFKKIKKYMSEVNSIIALHLLKNLNNLSDQQLEFVVINGGRATIEYISEIYRVVKNRNRNDLIDYLMYVWEKYGQVSPIKCPKCGFKSIMPDYSCHICGYVVSEDYVRRELDFENKFKTYVDEASTAELRDIANLGFVLLSDSGVYSPRSSHRLVFEKKIYFPIYLKSMDYSLILRAISSRELDI